MGWVEDPTLPFTKRIHCWCTTLVIFATIAALNIPVLSLKDSISNYHMDIFTPASVQLCSKQQMHPYRHCWCSLSFSAVLYDSPSALAPESHFTHQPLHQDRLKGSHYQHVNTMSPFPPHSSITNNRLGTRVTARQQKENTWDILSGA